MAMMSYIAYWHGLKQPQGGVDFQRAFSGAGFGMEGMRLEREMGHLTGDPQHPNLLGYIWMALGLPPKQNHKV